jgi:hypothetical protein
MSKTTKSAAAEHTRFGGIENVTAVRIATVGVAAVRTPSTRARDRAVWAAMENYAALITEAIPTRAVPLPLTQNDPAAVAARLTQLPSRVAAVFLIGLDPSATAQVQRAVHTRGGPTVIGELDVVTATLGAAAMSALRGRNIAPRRARLVVTGAGTVPRLGPLLIALGAGSMTTWRSYDTPDQRLRDVMARSDLLLDLADAAPDSVAPGRRLRLPGDLYDYGALVLPGLLRGLGRHRRVPLTVEVLAACARALVLVTAADAILPGLDERLLIPAIGRHVDRVLCENPPSVARSAQVFPIP